MKKIDIIYVLDKHISKNVDWLENLVTLCGQLYRLFMWGNNYDKLETAAEDLEMDFARDWCLKSCSVTLSQFLLC